MFFNFLKETEKNISLKFSVNIFEWEKIKFTENCMKKGWMRLLWDWLSKIRDLSIADSHYKALVMEMHASKS